MLEVSINRTFAGCVMVRCRRDGRQLRDAFTFGVSTGDSEIVTVISAEFGEPCTIVEP